MEMSSASHLLPRGLNLSGSLSMCCDSHLTAYQTNELVKHLYCPAFCVSIFVREKVLALNLHAAFCRWPKTLTHSLILRHTWGRLHPLSPAHPATWDLPI